MGFSNNNKYFIIQCLITCFDILFCHNVYKARLARLYYYSSEFNTCVQRNFPVLDKTQKGQHN